MALTKKQTKQLRALANRLNPILWVGKNDVTEASLTQADEALEHHELIKVVVQDGSGLTAKETAEALAEPLHADIVQVIGNRCVLFRVSQRKNIEHIRLCRD